MNETHPIHSPLPQAREDSHQLLRIDAVCSLIGLSKATIWNKLNPESEYFDPNFPKQIRISKKAVAWDRNEIIGWINQLKEQN